jgi:hypothetical protein
MRDSTGAHRVQHVSITRIEIRFNERDMFGNTIFIRRVNLLHTCRRRIRIVLGRNTRYMYIKYPYRPSSIRSQSTQCYIYMPLALWRRRC